jgi:hypothetical protein
MTRYKQYATTAYNRVDFSIQNVTPTSPPLRESLNATDFTATWDKIFKPTPRSLADDITMIKALTFSLGWLLRLYDDYFPDDSHSPITHLQNFLAVPQQFMVTCVEFVNQSMIHTLPGAFTLPDDMQTTAARGESMTRFLAQEWVVWIYIAALAFFVFGAGAIILHMVVRREEIPISTGFPEIDIAARLSQHEGREDGMVTLQELARGDDWQKSSSSSYAMAGHLRRRNIKVLSKGDGIDRRHEVFALENSKRRDIRPGRPIYESFEMRSKR